MVSRPRRTHPRSLSKAAAISPMKNPTSIVTVRLRLGVVEEIVHHFAIVADAVAAAAAAVEEAVGAVDLVAAVVDTAAVAMVVTAAADGTKLSHGFNADWHLGREFARGLLYDTNPNHCHSVGSRSDKEESALLDCGTDATGKQQIPPALRAFGMTIWREQIT